MTPSRPSLQALGAEPRAVVGDVLAVAQAGDRLLALEQALQARLALAERQLGRALAVEVQEIKDEEDEPIRTPFVHRCLEAAEDRHALGV
jgi:hypothetical protein